MRTMLAGLVGLIGAVAPTAAFSPNQILMMLAAFEAFQAECVSDPPVFSRWDAAALARMSTRYGVDASEAVNTRRIAGYADRMRDGVDATGKTLWCDAVRSEIEKILRDLGNS